MKHKNNISNKSSEGVFEEVSLSKTPFPFRRVIVVGTTGSGKTTFSAALARRFSLVHIELDALHWAAGWQEVPDSLFREKVEHAIRTPAWVVDGNYHTVRDLTFPRADAVIWLDYPFLLNFWRILSRTIRRIVTREILWNGNRESIFEALKIWSEESILFWFFKTYWRRKRDYPALSLSPEYAHLVWIRLRHPKEAERLLEQYTAAE